MRARSTSAGFALLLVLWIVAVLSAIALGLFMSISSEIKIVSADRDMLRTQQLAHSGHEFAAYLATRGLATPGENLANLPLEVVVPALHYRIRLPAGTIDLYLESESGKINPATASSPLLESFFTMWKGTPDESRLITTSVRDWSDPAVGENANGTDRAYYASLGYAPRNGGIGISDLALVRGLALSDFRPKYMPVSGGAEVRNGLQEFVTTAGVGATVNVNFAPDLILASVPGLSAADVQTIEKVRQTSFLNTVEQFESLTGFAQNSPALQYLSFGRGAAPAVLAMAQMFGSDVRQSERRVYYSFSGLNWTTGAIEEQSSLASVQHNVFPEFISP